MKHYCLTIVSKNKNTLKHFLKFFKNNEIINFNFIQTYFQNKNKKKLLTLLKSPHVNKSAQEQFETRLFSNKVTIYSTKNFQSLIFLKKIKISLFPDIKIKIKFFVNKNLESKTQKQLLNPNNFKIAYFKNIVRKQTYNTISCKLKKMYNNEKKTIKQTNSLLKIFDTYGELNLK